MEFTKRYGLDGMEKKLEHLGFIPGVTLEDIEGLPDGEWSSNGFSVLQRQLFLNSLVHYWKEFQYDALATL